MNIPVQNIYYLLAYAWDRLEEAEAFNRGTTSFQNIFDLLAKVLVNGTTHLLKRGLDRNYQEEETLTSKLRGKVLFQQSIKENVLVKASAYCAFDELSYDILHNQLLKATLKRLTKEQALDKSIQDEIHLLLQRLPNEITAKPVKLSDFKRVQLHRNNNHYKLLLSICKLIWRELLSTEETGEFPFKSFVEDEKRMANLFERFLFNFYKKHLPSNEWLVKRETLTWQLQPLLHSDDLNYIPAMKTDISLVSKDRYIIMDAKYYPEALKGQYNKEKIISPNLYQIFSYTQNLTNAYNKQIEGILIYPEVTKVLSLSYKFQPGNKAHIKVCTINLNQAWQGIESDLLKIVGY
ncbi:5-methylcytosine restriction system specificity protein McrC [Adhaeribacter radiodurans]|uniref:5-methylcytosine-specific restriction endonuclease system specificity protein McrC n=1 Tax=Adhaeribacter radiodurans TaxID=2745197 RepID=A0A7L7LCE0_9BACT|nr:hypothetical protein [Adhaeribacter radiodurans]QMU30510.1 hypothetical protein HUW48_21900 [Adhaeribacter radiodurans]